MKRSKPENDKPPPEAFCSLKDWPEDFSHENGNYWNVCRYCKGQFTGHKRRIICQECSKLRQEAFDALSPKEQAARTEEIIKQLSESENPEVNGE